MYKNIILLMIPLIFFSACLNKRGISSSYYNDCREYYDARGYYHKDCDENLVEFDELKKDAVEFITFTQEKEPADQKKVVW